MKLKELGTDANNTSARDLLLQIMIMTALKV